MELITCSEQRGDLASVWGLPGEVGTHEAESNAADKAKLGDVPAWRAKRVSELQGKVVRILDDSDEEPPQKRLREDPEAPRTPPRRVATSQPTPEFVRLQRGTTMELSPSFYEELHAVRAEAEVCSFRIARCSQRACDSFHT